jgi:hypothetical protein
MFASVALPESTSHIALSTASHPCLVRRALSASNFHTAAEKLSLLTVSPLAIFFGATSLATIVPLEPLHGMDGLAMDVTAARSSVKVASPAHPVSREESIANSKEMRLLLLEKRSRIVRSRMMLNSVSTHLNCNIWLKPHFQLIHIVHF